MRSIRCLECTHRVQATGATLLALLALLTLSLPITARAQQDRAPSVHIEVLGLKKPLLQNVMGSLSIADKKQRHGATQAYIRQLNARADQEIHHALEPFGYYRPFIRSELITDRAWIARYTVDPGPPIRLDTVRVELLGEGSLDPEFQKRVRDFPLHTGDILVHTSYEGGKAAFETYAAEAGYLDGKFVANRINVDLESYAAAITLRFDSGPRHLFGDVSFDQDVIDSGLIARFVTWKRGDPFDFRKTLALQTSLSSTGYFERVEVQPGEDLSGHREVPIVVALSPARRIRFTGGVGYGTDDGARVRQLTEWRRTNRQGHRAQIELLYGQIDKRAGLQYQIPRPNPLTDVITISTGYEELTTNVSTSHIAQAGLSATRQLGSWLATAALNYHRESFIVGVDTGTGAFLIPEGTWTRLRSDNQLYTRNGDRLRLDVRGAHDVLLSDATFIQPQISGKAIKSMSRMTRLIGRIDLGSMSTNAFHRLPASLRFFAGGANSVRGYGYNSLGPADSLGQVIGGRHLIVASVEANYLFTERWGVATFYDVGNAVNSFGDPLKSGVGIGLRWISPMGLVRGDVAWGLDRAGRALELHLMVGPEL